MKAYVINPADRTVTEVEYDGNYHSIYTLLSIPEHTVRDFDAVYVEIVDEEGRPEPGKPYDVFVDGEGLINNNPIGWFTVKGYPGLLRGKGLVLGHDGQGESVSPTVSLAEVTKAVGFPSEAQAFAMMLLNVSRDT